MIGVAAHHRAQRDQRVVMAGGGKLLQGQRNLKRAGHAHHRDAAGRDAERCQPFQTSREQAGPDRFVEACAHNGDA